MENKKDKFPYTRANTGDPRMKRVIVIRQLILENIIKIKSNY